MKIVKAIVSLGLLILAFWALNTRFGVMPPLGKLLGPSVGLWQNMEPGRIASHVIASAPGINDSIVVRYDSNMVPHISAHNTHDVYFAQGYITAKDRLWQMDMEVRTASGTLSEIFGARSLNHDIFYRRIGVPYSAARAFDSVAKDEEIMAMLNAYTEGVNAYIRQLSASEYPIEFKIFNYKPQEWKPINSLLIFKLMAEGLSGGEPEVGMTNALNAFGRDEVSKLFDVSYGKEEPVIPVNTRWDFVHLPTPDSSGRVINNPEEKMVMPHRAEAPGSNNWAVGGARSKSGSPMLANDPHLELTLPSVWYQAQLEAPGLNVYGVTIPGIPSVVIGFNEHVAWGLTNTLADVVDWYRIQFRNSSKREYLYDGQWDTTSRRIERFDVYNGDPVYDTITYTRQGPVVYEGVSHKNVNYSPGLGVSEGLAMRWTMHDISNDLKTFYLLNRAKDYKEYRQALLYFNCPAQNFAYADVDNNIAITCDGKLPIRYKGQGTFVLDGTRSADDWHGWIPMDQLPFSKNPDRGFVSSANQRLTDQTYPYYINGQFTSSARARRINERLARMNQVDADSFRILQTDTYSEFAADLAPFLLRHLDRSRLSTYKQVVNEIGSWDYRFARNSIGATLFDAWWTRIYDEIWDKNIVQKKNHCPWPDNERTALLLEKDSCSHWIKAVCDSSKVGLSDFVTTCFQKAIDDLGKRDGNIGMRWEWGHSHSSFIHHLGGIPSFGLGPFSGDGAANTINALTDRYGPSWRMVVELGPKVKGYGILPGGESGNPGSYFYDNLFPSWRDGKLNELIFLTEGEENGSKMLSELTLIK